jgi:hypothetical protein
MTSDKSPDNATPVGDGELSETDLANVAGGVSNFPNMTPRPPLGSHPNYHPDEFNPSLTPPPPPPPLRQGFYWNPNE